VFRRHRREDADQSGRDSGAGQDEQEFGDDPDERDELDDELGDESYDDEDESYDDEPEAPAEPAASTPRRGDDLGDPATWTRLRDAAAPGPGQRETGPWDAAGGFPEADRMDFGSLLVPMREGFDIQVNLDEEAGVWIAVVYGDSALQLQAFAAPKRSGIWDEVRQEIAAEVTGAGGRSEEADGPFGPELLARLTPAPGDGPAQGPQSLRFMGADGPRWFLRGLITGPAAQQAALARPFEEIFADVVVVRGDHAEPPRKALDIQLPDEARQAIEQQMEAEEQQQGMPTNPQGMPTNPFERGPEITEIH
jgi:hypothetical protein